MRWLRLALANSSTSKTNHIQPIPSENRQLLPPRKATAQQHRQIHADTQRPRHRFIKRIHRPNQAVRTFPENKNPKSPNWLFNSGKQLPASGDFLCFRRHQ